MWDEISGHPLLRGKTSWHAIGKPTPPPSSGNQSGRLIKQYRRLQVRFQSIFEKHGHSRIEKVVEILANSPSFVSISLRDPTAAPIIFERLNARGEKITTADLVRNEIFARSAANPTDAQIIFNSDWEPFSGKFSKKAIDLETLLFPYGLSINSSTTKASCFLFCEDTGQNLMIQRPLLEIWIGFHQLLLRWKPPTIPIYLNNCVET
jgi:hypothetical protein